MPSILLFGGDSGHRNLGDQAMLLEVTHRYRGSTPAKLQILCRNPAGMQEIPGAEMSTAVAEFFDPPKPRLVRSLFYRIPFLGDVWCLGRGAFLLARALQLRRRGTRGGLRGSGRNLAERLANIDMVHCYGGGFFVDSGRNAVSRPFCFMLIAARLLERRVAITGQGVGPITSRLDRWLVRQAFAGADVCSVREAGTHNPFLEELCRALPQIRRDGDDAIGLPAVLTGQALEQVSRDLGNPQRPLVAVQCRINEYTGRCGVEEGFVRLVDALIEELGVHILFIPTLDAQDCDDEATARRVWSKLSGGEHATVLPKGYSASEVRAIIAECDAAVGLSYHFLLFALSSGVGSIGLFQTEYYRLKLLGLFDHFDGSGGVVSMDTDFSGRVLARLQAILSEDEQARCRRRIQGRQMEERVTRTFMDILSLLPANAYNCGPTPPPSSKLV